MACSGGAAGRALAAAAREPRLRLGFLIVILGRQQLFTESTLTAMLPLLYRRDLASVAGLARVWGVVFAANIIGTIIFAFVVAKGEPVRPPRPRPPSSSWAGTRSRAACPHLLRPCSPAG